MEVIAPYVLKLLADRHIARYNSMITSGRSDVRIDECRGYLNLWKSMVKKNYDWSKFTLEERWEVQDAFYDEV